MRVLDKNEVSEVSGGTLCSIKGLFSLLKSKKSYCAPAPKVCAPAPKPRKGC